MIPLQLLPQRKRFAIRYLVHQGPKAVAVVHLYRVTKFVEEHIVDQVPGEEHEGEGKVDAATGRATAPMALAVENLYTRASEAVLCRQFEEARWQQAAGLVTERFFE